MQQQSNDYTLNVSVGNWKLSQAWFVREIAGRRVLRGYGLSGNKAKQYITPERIH